MNYWFLEAVFHITTRYQISSKNIRLNKVEKENTKKILTLTASLRGASSFSASGESAIVGIYTIFRPFLLPH